MPNTKYDDFVQKGKESKLETKKKRYMTALLLITVGDSSQIGVELRKNEKIFIIFICILQEQHINP